MCKFAPKVVCVRMRDARLYVCVNTVLHFSEKKTKPIQFTFLTFNSMKRLLTFLALCCLMVTGAWADGFQASTEVSPVKYVLTSAGDMTIAKDLTYSVYGANHSSKGEFAFIAAGETDTYYLYETTTRKYLKLADGAQTSCTNGVTGTASKGEAQTFTITASDVAGKWWIKPTTMETYLNFYGGWRAYTDNADAVGFYVEGADDGSRWDLTLADAGPVQYVLTSAANMSIATDLTYSEEGTSNCPRGRFSFISTGATDTYYLYENTSGKYVKLADGAVANGRNGVTFADSETDAQAFTVTPSDAEGKWWIKPTTMNTFLNFYGGVNQYKNTDKVGFYDHGNDNGSRWNLIEPLTFKSDAYYVLRCKGNNNYVTYNANANDGDGVNHLANAGNSTYSSQALFRIVTNGDQFNIIPAAAPSNYVFAINTNDADSNVGIGAPSGEETAATEKYLWNITQVSDGLFTIIPKGGSLSWNCRGSVNGVNVIGQWNAGNNNSRWTITEAAPFEAGKTYRMTLNGKNVKYNAGGSNFTLVSDTPEGNEFLYTIDGDPANGYTLYSVGASNYIGHTKDGAYTAGGADDAVASPNETAAHYDWYFNGTDVYLKIHGTNKNYLNDRGSLSTWNDASSLGNSGSKMTFTEVELPVVNYTVTINGAPNGQGGLTYKGVSYTTGDSFDAKGLKIPDLTATDVTAYAADITVGENTITVSYYLAPYTKGTQVTAQSDLQEGDLVILDVKAKKVEYHVWFTGEDATLTNKDNYRAKAYNNTKFPASYVWKVVNVTDGETPTFQLQSVANANAYLPIGDAHNSGNATANLYMQDLTSYSGENRVALSFTNGTNTSRSTYHFDSTQHTDAVKGIGVCFWGYNASSTDTQGAFAIYKAEETDSDPVEEACTLTPASGATIEKENVTISFEFTGEDADAIVWDQKTLPTLTKQGSDPIVGEVGMIDFGTGGISFKNVPNGTWTLTVPDGMFVLNGIGVPVKGFTATYTVAVPVIDEIAAFDYGWLPGTATPDAQWKAWTGDVPAGISTQNEFCTADNLFVITKRYEFTNEQNNLQVTFQHQGGNHRTEIVGVDVIAENGTVYSDYHHGYTGNAKDANVYTINNIPAGTYTVRYITTKHWADEKNKEIKGYITPVVTEPIPQITDLTQLSNDKAYVLICQRGQLSTSDGKLVPVAKDGEDAYTAETNKFAIIKSGDKYYLWSVAEEGYVHTTKYTNTVYAAQEITLTHQSDNTFLLKIAGKGMNMQDKASGIIIDDWVAADGGNKYAIYEVDDFADAEKAIAAIPGKIQVGKVYTIKAHFTGEDYTDHYLSSDASTEQLTLTDEDSATQSYWVAEASGNTERPWKFKSGYGYAKYLDWQNGGLTANGDNFKLIGYVNAGTPVSFDYNLNVSNSNRNIGAWADASKGFGAVGQGQCWAGNAGHNNSDWTTDYIIEEVTGVDVYTVSGNATAGITGITDYTYASSIGAGSVVIVPTGTELTSANFTTASDVAVIINSEAHTITVRTKSCPDEGTWYVTIENHETGRQPFLFNDVQYADEITLQGASHDTSKNGYIWKVTSDGAGNITVLNAENGKGIEPKSSNYSGNITSLQYEVYPEDANYFFLKFRTGSHDRLNATASGFSNEAGKKAVTTWDGNHPDNAWKFNTVDTEGLEEYNVIITQPEGCRGYALYDGKKAGNGGFLLAPADLEQSALTAGELRGFICDGVTLTDHTITLTYTTATPVQVNYTLYLKEGDTETLLETAAEAVTEYVGQAPAHPFTVPDYVDVTYDQGVDENGLIDGNATAIKVITSYNDLMPFTPGELTTVDIDIRNHYYFHVEERTITIDGESKKLWLPCISPKAPTFDDDAAYIWRMEGDWYHGFRFHNDQLAKEGEGDGTACHITYKHKEVMSETMEQMEGMKGETSLTEKTYTLESTTDLSIASRATLTGDADDRNSYFELVHATGNIQHYNGEPAEWQFRLMDHKNLYLNFRDYSAVGDNPDSLLCLYGAGYGDNASSFTFHKNEVCTEDDRQAVLAMIDAIEKGAVGALIDKDAQEYQDLLTLKGRIEDTTIGCTRALFDIYTEKLVNANKERKVATDGEAYRLAVRTKQGRNFYLKDDGTYTTDSLAASIYVLGSSADGTKKILAGNNNAALYYFRNSGLTQAAYETDACDLSCELMANKETVDDVLDATGAAKYATVCLTDGNGKVATMTSPDRAVTDGDCEWEAQDVVYMNDDLSSAIVMEPVPYPYNKPKFAVGSPDDHEGGYASIWLPYPMIFPDGVEVYRATDVESDGLLVLKKVNTDRVVAAGGYIIRDPNKATTMTVLPAPANPDDVEYSETNAFVGSTENPLVVKEEGSWSAFVEALGNPTGTPYVLAKKNEVIGYYKYNAGTDDLLPKGKAIWFSNYKADSSAECLRFTFEEVISAIEALHGNTDNAEIYDLQGHRLNKVEKGQVNVINGKKVMFK